MKAIALICRRVVLAPDAFVDVTVWCVPQLVPPSRQGFTYRLAYLVASECVLRYDNERHNGDHRHIGTVEAPYAFSTPDQLMDDFNADSARWHHENGRA